MASLRVDSMTDAAAARERAADYLAYRFHEVSDGR